MFKLLHRQCSPARACRSARRPGHCTDRGRGFDVDRLATGELGHYLAVTDPVRGGLRQVRCELDSVQMDDFLEQRGQIYLQESLAAIGRLLHSTKGRLLVDNRHPPY